MLWADKYRPKTLDQCIYHPEVTKLLSQLVRERDLPHIPFYGSSGAGDMTRVRCLLNDLFGPGSDKCRVETREVEINGSSSNKVELEIVRSNHHIQICPADVGSFKDRCITQVLIKELAETPLSQTRPYRSR